MKCHECGRTNGHEINCAFSTVDLSACDDESQWVVVTDQGRRIGFILAPMASAEFAVKYVESHTSQFNLRVEFGVGGAREAIVAVERA